VSNTDDHLRNHGFILTTKGWILSPAFDINPNPYGNGLKLNISETDNSLKIDLAKEVAQYFRLNNQEVQEIIEVIQKAVKNWKKIALNYQISKLEQDQMAQAFENYL
jgi:serine/threonine-protein kinase HipA